MGDRSMKDSAIVSARCERGRAERPAAPLAVAASAVRGEERRTVRALRLDARRRPASVRALRFDARAGPSLPAGVGPAGRVAAAPDGEQSREKGNEKDAHDRASCLGRDLDARAARCGRALGGTSVATPLPGPGYRTSMTTVAVVLPALFEAVIV